MYFVGGHIDRTLFADKLPTPTYGTPGIFWASLTLALLTLPVVIVATEEALSAVPRGVREAALACGASKWQTIQRVVLPASLPGITSPRKTRPAPGSGPICRVPGAPPARPAAVAERRGHLSVRPRAPRARRVAARGRAVRREAP